MGIKKASKSNKFNIKSLILLFVGLIFLFIAAYYLILKPNSSATAGWITYSDNQFFQLKYPPDWTVNPEKSIAGFNIQEIPQDKSFGVFAYLSNEGSKDFVDRMQRASSISGRASLDKNGYHYEIFSYTQSNNKTIIVSKGTMQASINTKINSLYGDSVENSMINNFKFINERANDSLAKEVFSVLAPRLNAGDMIRGFVMSVNTIDKSGKYVSGSFGGDQGGSGFLAMKINNSWKLLQTGQQAGSCADLKQRNSLDEATISEIKALNYCDPHFP